MCRDINEPGTRRCYTHSPECRSAVRAEKVLDSNVEKFGEGLEELATDLNRKVDAGSIMADKAFSLWLDRWAKSTQRLATETATLLIKNSRADKLRDARNTGRLATLSTERVEAAIESISKHEEAILALHSAKSNRRMVSTMESLDICIDLFGEREERFEKVIDQLKAIKSRAAEVVVGIKIGDQIPELVSVSAVAAYEQFIRSIRASIEKSFSSPRTKGARQRVLTSLSSMIAEGAIAAAGAREERDTAMAARGPRAKKDQQDEKLLEAA